MDGRGRAPCAHGPHPGSVGRIRPRNSRFGWQGGVDPSKEKRQRVLHVSPENEFKVYPLREPAEAPPSVMPSENRSSSSSFTTSIVTPSGDSGAITSARLLHRFPPPLPLRSWPPPLLIILTKKLEIGVGVVVPIRWHLEAPAVRAPPRVVVVVRNDSYSFVSQSVQEVLLKNHCAAGNVEKPVSVGACKGLNLCAIARGIVKLRASRFGPRSAPGIDLRA